MLPVEPTKEGTGFISQNELEKEAVESYPKAGRKIKNSQNEIQNLQTDSVLNQDNENSRYSLRSKG